MTPGGAASGKRGSKYERETVNRLRGVGYGALRLPSSGSATDRELPDILVGTPHIETLAPDDPRRESDYPDSIVTSELWAIELKASKADIVYVDAEEVTELKRFSERFGATAYLGVRSTQQATPTATFLVTPDDARRKRSDAAWRREQADAIEAEEGAEADV